MSARRDSIGTSPLELAAEVAYIVATSPPPADQEPGGDDEDEFQFSFSETKLRKTLQQEEVPEAAGAEKEAEKSPGRPGEREQLAVEETDSAAIVPRGNSETSNDYGTPRRRSSDAGTPPGVGESQKTIVIYGPTNYANRQLVNRLVQSNPSIFTSVVPHTSRRQRQNELNGVDFHFLDRKQMSAEIKKGNFVECVKISASPMLKPKRLSSLRESSDINGSSSASTSGDAATNPWKKEVQVPSPLLTPKSSRVRSKSSGKSSELYGTSREAVHKARLQGKPCVVLNVTCKGTQQLRKAGCDGVYILLDVGGEGTDSTDDGEGQQPDHHITAESIDQAFLDLQRLAFQAVSDLPLTPRTKVDVTRDEWESLPTVQMDQQFSEATSPVTKTRLLTFTDLLVHYQRERIGAKPTKTKKTTTSLSKGLRAEYDLVLSLSSIPLSDTVTLHIEALQTIYQKLMGSSLNCRRYGPHWQDIGFQGVDPGESVKAVGFFGIMQLVSFLEHCPSLATEIFSYSTEGTYKFPFAVVSINLTEAALKALRDGHLTKLCNKQEQVIVALNDYHAGLFYRFYRQWRSQSTPSQIPPVIRDVASYAKKHPKAVISDVVSYLWSGKDEHELAPVRKISHSLGNPFTPFPKLDNEQETQTPTTPSS
jgi:guanylate kinase